MDAGRAVEAASMQVAFPHWLQWRDAKMDDGTPILWALAWASTSAEETVKREGMGSDGHWCGDRWPTGSEKDCPDERHRARPTPDEAQALLDRLLLRLSYPPSGPVRAISPPPEAPAPRDGSDGSGGQRSVQRPADPFAEAFGDIPPGVGR